MLNVVVCHAVKLPGMSELLGQSRAGEEGKRPECESVYCLIRLRELLHIQPDGIMQNSSFSPIPNTPQPPFTTEQWFESSVSKKSTNAFQKRVTEGHVLLESPPATYIRKLGQRKKRKAQRASKKMSQRQKRIKGVGQIPAHACNYALFEPLHALWIDYVRELFGPPVDGHEKRLNMVGKLIKADYHGARIEVYKSRNSSLVGVKGVVVKETENTFQIISRSDAGPDVMEIDNKEKDSFKTVPKAGSIFLVDLPPEYGFKAELYGSQIAVGSLARIGKKFRGRNVEL